MDFSWIHQPEGWAALATLTLLEIVLGIDNIVFISILSSKLPVEQQPRARTLGLALALIGRLLLLFSLSWMMRLTEPLFFVLSRPVSGRDLILLIGGLFLIGKATIEIHDRLEGPEDTHAIPRTPPSFAGVLFQILLLDMVFSLDSVITAVGMAEHISIMALAIVIAIGIMMLSAHTVSSFIQQHPTIKMLALSFLLLIGTSLVAEGLGFHIPKGYIYFAMAFSLFVEMLNLRLRAVSQPVTLHPPPLPKNVRETLKEPPPSS